MLVMSAMLTGCTPAGDSPDNGQAGGEESITARFIYIGPATDGGYSQAHDNGRKQLGEALGDKVKTIIIENVPESAEVEKVMRDMIDQGVKVIFATSFGYMDYVAKVAREHPEVAFLHASESTTLDSMGSYFGKMYEPRYLSGTVAGMKTESNKIGYVAAMPIPEVIRMINAFTLGVQSVNPEATVEVTWTNTWFDPAK